VAEPVANSKVAIRATRVLRRRLRTAAAAMLAAGTLLPAARAVAQQNGPPSSGQSAAILFVPATLNPVSGFNPANGHLNGAGYGGDGSLANSSSSQFSYPVGMAYDSSGNLFIADESNYIVRRIDAVTGDLSTFAGTPKMSGFSPSTGSGSATSAEFGLIAGLVVDSSSNVYVSDRTNNVVWKITSGGTISIFAGDGTGTCGGAQSDTLGDGCPASDATLDNPWALGIDAANDIYIADSYNDLVREVSSSTGKITIFAGDVNDAGSFGSCNANLYSTSTPPYLPTQAHLCFPEGIAFDSSGNAYISEATRDDIRIINASGYISIFAGTPGTRSSTGDGGPANAATLDEPAGLYVDPAGRVYISDFFGGEIRVVDSTGNINDVMGGTHGELNNYSIGEPDTESILNPATGQYSGATDGLYSFAMDPYGNIIGTDSSGDAITSAGTTGQYFFGNNNQIYQTATTTSLNAFSALYPPYITISNPSGVTLNFTGTPTVTTLTPSATPAAFAIAGGTCTFPGALAPGATCTVVVSFTPTVDGAYTGSIVIDSNANSSPSTINLSGSGSGVCYDSATLTSPLSFSSPPNVTTAAKTTTLTNTGTCPISTNTSSATIINNNPSGSSTFTLVSNDCPATLNVGDTCTLGLDFKPTALVSYSAQLELDIPSYGDIYSYLNGTGITAPAVSFNPTPIDFPATSAGATATAVSTVLTNIGNAPLTNIVISLAGTDPGNFAFSGTNNCPTAAGSSLAAGASCTISVNFSPQAGTTNYSATISVADNATGTPQTVPLNGTLSAGGPNTNLNISETIHFADAPVLTPSTLLSIAEKIHFSDSSPGQFLTPSTLLNISEVIHTSDAPNVFSSVLIQDNEIVHTTDTPAIKESKLILDAETIHTTDTPAANLSKLILDTETVHITDAPAVNLSKLILDTETIHTTDTPATKILVSPTTTVLTSSALVLAAGTPVTFTAAVASPGGTPTGQVTFYDGATALSTVALSNGVATYVTSSLSDGVHSVKAVYLGNAGFLTSTSNVLTETVSDFHLTISPPSLVLLPSGKGTLTLTATPEGGAFSLPIDFTVSGLPAGATDTFSPPSITPGTAPASSTLTIQAPAQAARNDRSWPLGARTSLALGALLPFLGLLRIRRARMRGFGLTLLALVSLCAAAALSGCTGGGFFTQPPQNYTVTITAASGSAVHSTSFELTVE
jgi:hypothetical protein